MLTFVHAFIVFAAVAATSATSSQLPVVAEGKLASVVLLQAGRASSEDLKACCQGAKGGLKLVFLMRPIDDPIEVTLSPQVETLIDRQPYLATDKDAGGPRPQLEVRDVDDLFRRYPDLAARVPPGFKPHLGLIVTIPGTPLPESGQVDFSMKLGYHKQLERFSFAFALP
ncbi:MAG TPA: hypothetical protein VIE43_21105 [Thermoanaerobaculia bacterium]|nr:hypothetical protein [Thermoanaerobaculia bacterium]